MERPSIFDGKTHYFDWAMASIAMLNCQRLLNMVIYKLVDLSMKNGGSFHSFLYVYQRLPLLQHRIVMGFSVFPYFFEMQRPLQATTHPQKIRRRLLRRRRESPPPLPATASSRRCTCRALKAGFRFFPASENMFRLFRLIYHQIYNVRPQRYLSWGPHNSNVTNWFMVRT